MKQVVKAGLVVGLAMLGPGTAWTSEWRTLRSVERWQLQETDGRRGPKFRIVTKAMSPGDFSLIYRCDRVGTDNIALVRKRRGTAAQDPADHELRYETGGQTKSLPAVDTGGRSFSFRRGTPPYSQIFQDLMRSNLITFEVGGLRRSFLVAGFAEAAGKLQVQCRSRQS